MSVRKYDYRLAVVRIEDDGKIATLVELVSGDIPITISDVSIPVISPETAALAEQLVEAAMRDFKQTKE